MASMLCSWLLCACGYDHFRLRCPSCRLGFHRINFCCFRRIQRAACWDCSSGSMLLLSRATSFRLSFFEGIYSDRTWWNNKSSQTIQRSQRRVALQFKCGLPYPAWICYLLENDVPNTRRIQSFILCSVAAVFCRTCGFSFSRWDSRVHKQEHPRRRDRRCIAHLSRSQCSDFHDDSDTWIDDPHGQWHQNETGLIANFHHLYSCELCFDPAHDPLWFYPRQNGWKLAILQIQQHKKLQLQ